MRRQKSLSKRAHLLPILLVDCIQHSKSTSTKSTSTKMMNSMMNFTTKLFTLIAVIVLAFVSPKARAISGDYLEIRSCDIYTGPCFANAEMGLSGKEGMLVWSIKSGGWNGVSLAGLKVIAVVATQSTLGDLRYEPSRGKAVVIIDQAASPKQQEALLGFVKSMAGHLIEEVREVKTSSIQSTLGICKEDACASIKAGDWLDISTRCIGDKDHLCGNERIFYPPLTKVQDARPALTQIASYRGSGLDRTWQLTDYRSAFLAKFDY